MLANFYQFTGGRLATEPRLPAVTPKPQQLHKLAVPPPDLLRRQVRSVHAGIRKQPSFPAGAARANCSSGGKRGVGMGQGLSSPPKPSYFIAPSPCTPRTQTSIPLKLDSGNLNGKVIEMYPPARVSFIFLNSNFKGEGLRRIMHTHKHTQCHVWNYKDI